MKKNFCKKFVMTAAVFAVMAGGVNAARADERSTVTEEGTVTPAGKVKAQSGFEFKRYDGDASTIVYSLVNTVKYGVMKNVEASGSIPVSIVSRVPEGRPGSSLGLEDLTLGGKYQVLTEKENGFDAAVKANIVIPFGQKDKAMGLQAWQLGVRGVASKTIGNEKIGWVTINGIVGGALSEAGHNMIAGASAVVGPQEGAHVFIEGVAMLIDGEIRGSQTFGGSYPVMANTRVDVAFKTNPALERKDSDHSATVGVTMLF